MRLDGIRTPVPNLMRLVLTAAAPIATKQSALNIWVSYNQAFEKPSSSARCITFHESAEVANAIPKSIPNSDKKN